MPTHLDFNYYQDAFLVWEQKNFGNKGAGKDPRAALAGIMEEIGEFSHFVLKGDQEIREAVTLQKSEFVDKTIDCLVDAQVYLLALLNNETINLRMANIYEQALQHHTITLYEASKDLFDCTKHLMRYLGKLADSIDEPWIRPEKVQEACKMFIVHMIQAFLYLNRSFTAETIKIFDKVLQRDWNKDRVNGGDLDAKPKVFLGELF